MNTTNKTKLSLVLIIISIILLSITSIIIIENKKNTHPKIILNEDDEAIEYLSKNSVLVVEKISNNIVYVKIKN